jgi:hypothetical protein
MLHILRVSNRLADQSHRFNIEVGTPPQSFQVLPSFQAQNSWVPIVDECVKISADPAKCGTSRGVQPFAQRSSAGKPLDCTSLAWKEIEELPEMD